MSILLVLNASIGYSQITLSGGAELIIHSGTTIQLNSFQDSLKISDSSVIQNNGRIILNNKTQLFEQTGHPITGNGHEISIFDTLSIGWNEPGNLGFKMNNSIPQSTNRIYRFHSDTLSLFTSFSSINRYYSVAQNLLDTNLYFTFEYDSTELNNLPFDSLKLINYRNSNLNIFNSDVTSFSVSGYVDSLSLFTLTPFNLSFDFISDTVLCVNDSINFTFHSEGFLNSENKFILWITNGIDSLNIDTFLSEGNYQIPIPILTSAGLYDVYISSSSPSSDIIYSSSLQLNSLPVVDFASLNPICENNNPIILNSLPLGGFYSGTGIVDSIFDPENSGTGNFILNYTVTDSNGCTQSDTSSILVNSVTEISFNLFNPLCENDSLYSLTNASPSGGIYSGSGVNGNDFDPSIGAGNYFIHYTYTNNFGCIDVDSSSIVVNSLDQVSFIPFNDLCDNDPILNLNQASPFGGAYSGLGVTANDFDPSIGMGNYFIVYEFTNGNGCTDIDSSSINVLQSPSVPIITQNVNTLISDSGTSYQWYLNGNILSGENNDSISPLIDGTYYVEVSNSNNCISISDPIDFFFNSVNESEKLGIIQIYPNPASNFIQIYSDSKLSNAKVTLMNLEGKLLVENEFIDVLKIDLTQIASGYYILQIKSNENQQIFKFVIER